MIKGILITVTNKVWTPGIKKGEFILTEKQQEEFYKFMAEVLKYELIRAIEKQRYSKVWTPLSFSWFSFKKKHNLSIKIWEATGQMKESIKVFRRGSYIVVGFKNSDVYPDTGLSINSVARKLEYGYDRIPARPLFRPLTEFLGKHVSIYFEEFMKQRGYNGR